MPVGTASAHRISVVHCRRGLVRQGLRVGPRLLRRRHRSPSVVPLRARSQRQAMMRHHPHSSSSAHKTREKPHAKARYTLMRESTQQARAHCILKSEQVSVDASHQLEHSRHSFLITGRVIVTGGRVVATRHQHRRDLDGRQAALRNRVSVFEFSLCLSRACLGKMIIFSTKWRKKTRFLTSHPRTLTSCPTARRRGRP